MHDTQLTNRTHGRVGHVFQGRLKAVVVDKDNYLLELARHVVLNPVRAGMVQDPVKWPWSSYGAMLAPGWLPGADWLAIDKLLAYFAPDQKLLDRVTDRLTDREEAQQRYVNHVREGIGMAAEVAHVSCTDLPPLRKWF